jgi:hypothetical protein
MLLQGKARRTNHSLVYKDCHPISSSLHVFLYIPDTADSQFFSIVFDVFFDADFNVLVLVLASLTIGQWGIVGL